MADADFEEQLKLEELERRKKELREEGISDPYTYVDPNDGTVYEWDSVKQAYFPKIDDDFIAKYQSNYNYQEPETSAADKTTSASEPPHGEKRKASEPSWFEVDDAHNTNVYVTGLPLDITEQEFGELMSKCGLVMKDPATMKYRVKLYRQKDGQLKGDGLCCYIKIESITLALDILDGYVYKGKTIHVERAKFQLKGQYDPSKKPKKLKAKEKEKMKKKREKLFEWGFEKLRGERSKNEKTVIIKNMFEPKEFDEDATLLLDYQKDIREECSKCGEVKKVVVYDRNPEGVVAVTFAEPEMADECINLMNLRWFAGRQLSAETWDGKTKYKVIETEEERQKRIQKWDTFLEGKDSQGAKTPTPTNSTQNEQTSSKLSVPSNAYELAGETDSSGDSDGEDTEKSSGKQESYPVMQANGGLSFGMGPPAQNDS